MAVYDEPIIIEGLRSIIGRTESMVFVGAVASPDELFAALGATHCDVIIMDYVISDEDCGNPDGLYLLRQIRVSHPAIRSILFTGWNRAGLSESAIAMGADAVLCKRDSLDVLTKTIQVLAGDDMRFAPTRRVHVGPPAAWVSPFLTGSYDGPQAESRAVRAIAAPAGDGVEAACVSASVAPRERRVPPAPAGPWSTASAGLAWHAPFRGASHRRESVEEGVSNRVTGNAVQARHRTGPSRMPQADPPPSERAGQKARDAEVAPVDVGSPGALPFDYLLAGPRSSRLPSAPPPYDALIRCPNTLASTVSQGARGVWLENRLSLTRLSPRETEIVRLLSNGRSLKEVATYLGRSPKTISNQKRSAMLKLGLHSDIDLLRFAIEAGLT
jgi:DNA-binding NarL/FixJ family response regulator